ncbi:hypothetical protein BP6252_12944 [Coleophoma cylindrospora]|uniref:Uncharacterized protein n=1 Tax=Coleophoma cylindrospora TaxID=1849047 RepID=A0A3D8QDQ3_9HELO|nr:hypothetical protein BP6252_12944 [Coleophoma cylindrospora]
MAEACEAVVLVLRYAYVRRQLLRRRYPSVVRLVTHLRLDAAIICILQSEDFNRDAFLTTAYYKTTDPSESADHDLPRNTAIGCSLKLRYRWQVTRISLLERISGFPRKPLEKFPLKYEL